MVLHQCLSRSTAHQRACDPLADAQNRGHSPDLLCQRWLTKCVQPMGYKSFGSRLISVTLATVCPALNTNESDDHHENHEEGYVSHGGKALPHWAYCSLTRRLFLEPPV